MESLSLSDSKEYTKQVFINLLLIFNVEFTMNKGKDHYNNDDKYNGSETSHSCHVIIHWEISLICNASYHYQIHITNEQTCLAVHTILNILYDTRQRVTILYYHESLLYLISETILNALYIIQRVSYYFLWIYNAILQVYVVDFHDNFEIYTYDMFTIICVSF